MSRPEDFRSLESVNPVRGNGRSPYVIAASVFCALVVTAGLLFGYINLLQRRRQQEAQRLLAEAQASAGKALLPAQVQIYEDEALIKGSQAIIGGTIQNISDDNLSDLSVEIELKRRKDYKTETRSVKIDPSAVGPNQQGKYFLAVQSRDYSNARLLKLKSGLGAEEIRFKVAHGAKRPPEPPPQATKTVIIERPSPPKRGEEFLNSPDNPARLP